MAGTAPPGLKLEVRRFGEANTHVHTGSIRAPNAVTKQRVDMTHLVRERRIMSGPQGPGMDRRRANRAGRLNGVIPEVDLAAFSQAAVAHRLAQFGIDADAEPLLERRKRGL